MSSTVVNSWITLTGCGITVFSIWASLIINNRSRRERRIQDVMSKTIELRIAGEHPPVSDGPLKRFITAGALTLSQKELEECAARLVKAGETNPLEHPRLTQRDVLKRAKEKGVNLDNWASRTAFLIREATGNTSTSEDPPAK
jgi:hypothetical protein